LMKVIFGITLFDKKFELVKPEPKRFVEQ